MVLDVESCAKLLHCSVEHLNRLARGGDIPATKIGRSWIFLEDEIVGWLRSKTRSQKSPAKVGRPRKQLLPC